jgi:hypothetical protein
MNSGRICHSEKEGVMIQMSIYTVQREARLRNGEQRQAKAEQAELTRMLWAAAKSSQPKPHARTGTPTLKRLVRALGYT